MTAARRGPDEAGIDPKFSIAYSRSLCRHRERALADVMANALAQVILNAPVVPVVCNVTAAPTSDPKQILDALVAQVTATVRWRESIVAMTHGGATTFYELGAGKVLCGLAKRIASGAQCFAIGTPDEVRAFTLPAD